MSHCGLTDKKTFPHLLVLEAFTDEGNYFALPVRERTERIFTNPKETRTEDYVTGKFG